MDLLDSILGSMDKPPSLSEQERKKARELKKKQEEEDEEQRQRRNDFKHDIEVKIGKFLEDMSLKRLTLPPYDKLGRMIIHEVAEAAGVLAQSFGEDEVDRHIVLFKKEFPPSENELRALRNGEDYDPAKDNVEEEHVVPHGNERLHPQAKEGERYGMPSNYQEKYRKLLGGLDCAEKSAVKMQPNKSFGYVPSSNKRDLRSIEQTLNDMKSRKKPKLDSELSPDSVNSPPPIPE